MTEAMASYERALDIDPRDAGIWNNKGVALLALGRKEEAVACYDRALEIDPEFAVAWNNKGAAAAAQIWGARRRPSPAIDRALEIGPRDAAVRGATRAVALLGSRRLRTRVPSRALRRALANRPQR